MTTKIDANLLEHLPAETANLICTIMESVDFDGHFSANQYQELLASSELSDSDFKIALLPLAAARSHCPISNFHVGAIAEGNSGAVYFGANIEISQVQLSQTVHAEQSVISHAWMKGETGLKTITINHTPCGHCRQFMNELNQVEALSIQLPGRPSYSLQQLLPDSFGPKDLDIEARLMGNTQQAHQIDDLSPVVQAALGALNMSHAPYTQSYSGVALQVKSGEIYNGGYAENAAFNPSLPPLQVAINLLLLAGHALTDITNAALIENSQGSISNLGETQSTLEAINPDISLTYISL